MATARGLFVVFEGLDKCGKTTQSQRLTDTLASQGCPVTRIQFPDRTTKIGEILNAFLKAANGVDPHAAHLLFSANRWEWHNKLRDLLENGTTVICDRYAHSGVAYSVGALRFDPAWCLSPDKGLIAPDVIYYLAAPDQSLANNLLEKRGPADPDSRELYEEKGVQQKVQAEFDKFEAVSKKAADNVWVRINALESIEEVAARIEQDLKVRMAATRDPIRLLWDWSPLHSHERAARPPAVDDSKTA
eukprot:Protomagalhaensia_wolfi_Nauph_80__4439@NODE_454_length_2498_cov_69_622611_g319_i1_p2_GENE_NODE_454_length_2498_cov_69_622611_g319_i1NODE_454_length_2498_cov_69_622611_g319_i1_p2_ORF_typecomplete_len259_score42_93Thymidylate_kin/PF02223_17/1_1e44AAA_33/PF13671_6/0_0017PPK2/PF03976_14/0_0018AAA_16/PF13191_6/0_0016APS_kinase/PF01583_20/0_003AAA_22/PF13401_6/0_026AAA_22/PF13401_6/6_9e02AAA_28/PF13521_6/0_0078AAA_17/PF13207_6/0_41AAA_17/PF13207_6/4_2e03_NODE_454_length_2498_cov_69_622611_g319_i141778